MVNLVTFLTLAIISAQSLFTLAPRESERIPRGVQPLGGQPIDNAQKTGPQTPPPFAVQPLTLPQGENAWAVHIVSRGGFIGVGRGDLTVMSDGFVSWKGVDGTCSRRLTDDPMRALAKIVTSVEASANWGGSKVSGPCYDCYVTALVLQRRELGGIETTYASFWDDSTQAEVPANVMKLYEAFMAFRGCRL